MPKEFDKILEGVKRSNSGKINPRTKKPYTESEMYAIATEQYKKTKKDFEVFTPITKSWEEQIDKETGTKQRFVEVAVSGIKEDRDGERMAQEAIDDMIMQFKSGTIGFFPDHGKNEAGERTYSWKQIMGVWVDAHQEDEKLKAVVRLNNANPDSELFWKYVKEGMPVGFSIGGKPVKFSDEEIEVEE